MAIRDILKNASQSVTSGVKSQATAVSHAKSKDAEMKRLKGAIVAIDNELNSAYIQIGKKYFEHARTASELSVDLGVNDILLLAEDKIERKEELQREIFEIEKRLKDQVVLQQKAQVQKRVDEQMEKLDNAKNLGVITDEEYAVKAEKINRPLVNFEMIRNIEKQYEMGLITAAERNQRISDLT